MSMVSIFVLFILGFSMFATGVMLVYALINNYYEGQSVRKQLNGRVSQLRYGKILALFSVNKNIYLHTVPLTRIEAEMRTCQACDWTDACDKALQHPEYVNDEVLRFCPNATSINSQRMTC